ncbi:MerR family transcriptional regulator [Pseudochrobactrum kiredjianiae]|uniref:Helix-turn-helix domain-containing protein n=1 Tax=Pseudochrobactrum kiredjianiae TaxID=386305 RepID=A0ABW3V9X0_9HYPH|nr:helix-turn-helix domain-containing protein [Pseudochrobactrum kiredjianiae]MDM7850340.1 helix-turn-helix domain-containing protein [Pseudochrobactrum kiredjianiae]
MDKKGYTIGKVAERSGVKVPTIRFYEQIGLIREPERTENQRREYGAEDIKRLSFIRHARDLGFEINDIRELLAMTETPNASCHEADSIARRHLDEIEDRIERLSALRDELRRMVSECDHGRLCECRVIQILEDHGQCGHDHDHPVTTLK